MWIEADMLRSTSSPCGDVVTARHKEFMMGLQQLFGIRAFTWASSADLGDWLCKMLGICA